MRHAGSQTLVPEQSGDNRGMTPAEKIALTSVVASGVVGLAGVLAAGLGGWRDRAAARELAREERRQARLSDTYVDLLDLAERVGYWVAQLRPITAADDYQPPAPPTTAEQTRVKAKLAAHGSADVKALHQAWYAVVREIMQEDHRVLLRLQASKRHEHYKAKAGEDVSWRDPTEPWAKIHDELLPQEAAAREALFERVAAELS